MIESKVNQLARDMTELEKKLEQVLKILREGEIGLISWWSALGDNSRELVELLHKKWIQEEKK